MDYGFMGSCDQPLSDINFACKSCGHKFLCSPDKVLDDETRPWHPFEYFANCEECGDQAPQAWWEKNLLKGHANSTGPKTAHGKSIVSKNLEGHPTPEEAKRTRFNALKHGAFASAATYFPTKPGKYPQCNSCEYLNNGCDEKPTNGHKNPPACLKRTELFMRHQVAFDSGDVKMLTGIRADTQAMLQAILQDMLMSIAGEGAAIKTPEWFHDKDGGFHLARYKDDDGNWNQIEKIEEHPLLKRVIDYVAKNNLSLADMGMTPKVQEENELLAGRLDGEKTEKEDLLEYKRQQTDAMTKLVGMIERSQERVKQDDIYIEHKEQNRG